MSRSNEYIEGMSDAEFRRYMIAQLDAGDARMLNLERSILRIERNTVIIRKVMRFKRSTDVVFGTLSPIFKWMLNALLKTLMVVAGIAALFHATTPDWLREWLLILGHK